MTKLLINKLKQDLKAEPSAASEQGNQVKKQFNILDEQLGPNLEAMSNFFGNIDGIDKFDLDSLNPFKKEGFIGQEGHGNGENEHKIHQSVDGRTIVNTDIIDNNDVNDVEEYKLFKQYDFQKTHTKSQTNWVVIWAGVLFILLIIKMYFFLSTFFFGGTTSSTTKPPSTNPDSSNESSSPSIESTKTPASE
tara:strand:- start:8747 stop:9322 length:576 start_codon:yes stop_codon:yes gene_type:complete